MRKANKSEVDYSRGHAGAHCGKVLDDDKASAGLREKRSDIWFCEVPGGVQAPGHRHSASLGKRFLRHGGKRSDIDSWNLIQSVPEPRSLGVCIGVRLLLGRRFYFGPAKSPLPGGRETLRH